MILVFDVGNTELTIGLFSESELRGHWRVMTDVARTADEFGVLLQSLLQTSGFGPDVVRSVAIGSVVPRVTGAAERGVRPLFHGRRAAHRRRARRLCRSRSTSTSRSPSAPIASSTRWRRAASSRAMRSSSTWARRRRSTASRPTACSSAASSRRAFGRRRRRSRAGRRSCRRRSCTLPSRVIGRRTEECIRAGVMFGGADAIDGLVRRIKASWPRASDAAGDRDRRVRRDDGAALHVVRSRRAVSDAPGARSSRTG